MQRFNKLPSDPAAMAMTESDYLYCYINMVIDDEENSQGCSCQEYVFNESFDLDEYKRKCGVKSADI